MLIELIKRCETEIFFVVNGADLALLEIAV